MVSAAQYDAELDFGYLTPDNHWISCYKANVQQTGPGGSSEGAIATQLTDNASWKMPLILKPAYPGCVMNVRFRLNTADGIDKSDGIFVLPTTVKNLRTGNASVTIMRNTDFGTATDLPAASITGVWYEYGTGFTVPSGQEICWGTRPGLPSFCSIENDA